MKIGKKEILFVGFALIAFGVFMFFYSDMGGFNEVKVERRENTSYQIKGKFFEGSVKGNKEFAQLFLDVEKLIEEQGLETYAMAYYERTPTENNDYYTRAFIGALLTPGDTLVYEGAELKTIKFDQSLYGEQEAERLGVAVQNKLSTVAEDSSLVLDAHKMIEFYYTPTRFGLEIPYHVH